MVRWALSHSVGSVAALAEVGVDLRDQVPKALTRPMVLDADLVAARGREAQVEPVDGTPVEIWDTDEPSLRGIEGMQRMRIIRDDIAARVRVLVETLA